VALEMLGADGRSTAELSEQFLGAIAKYQENSKNLQLDGVKIPHLYPGTKLQMRPAGTNGGVGTGFEESLLRHTAAALGLSYEEYSRDFSKTNYSSARAAMTNTWKYMQSRKKMVADKFATQIYWLWLEEAINAGDLPMPTGAPSYYDDQNKEAYGKCSWIGASRGQIDELKETQAAVLRMDSGLATLEGECGKLGYDWRELLKQKSREQKLAKTLGVVLNLSTQKPTTTSSGEDATAAAGDAASAPASGA
jgi:lambda family phage portal protein